MMQTNQEQSSKKMNFNELLSLKDEFQNELYQILSYWSTEAIDTKNGGFIGEIDAFGYKNYSATKGVVLNTRILWTFSAAFNSTKKEDYKKIATIAFNYITTHFWDQKNKGLFWELDYIGNPLNTRKQAYAQGFGIYAFSEYYKATKNTKSLLYAKELHFILENFFYDKDNVGYIEALSEDWKTIDDMRLSGKDMNLPKSMNTHLHILEPYTNLYSVWKNEKLKNNIINLISIFQNKIIDKNTGHFNLFFDDFWNSKSEIISFGHDIEGAWLLHEAAEIIDKKPLLNNIKNTALELVNITLLKGIDTDGSVFNEQNKNHIDTEKHWWVQAEAMVGLMDAYQITKNDLYLQHLNQIWRFIKKNVKDEKHGEWFWRITKEKNPILEDYKVGFWKCPYHNSRALMELIKRINSLKKE